MGRPVPEGRILLYNLTLQATLPEVVYSHKWRPGDLVILRSLHDASRSSHDEAYSRDLRRATTLDTGSTLDEVA